MLPVVLIVTVTGALIVPWNCAVFTASRVRRASPGSAPPGAWPDMGPQGSAPTARAASSPRPPKLSFACCGSAWVLPTTVGPGSPSGGGPALRRDAEVSAEPTSAAEPIAETGAGADTGDSMAESIVG